MSKVALWDRAGTQLDRVTRANETGMADGYRTLDFQGISDWIVEALAGFADHSVQAIIPIGHGAAFAALAGETLAFPPPDYDQPIPEPVMSEYRSQRDPFGVTGSPALGNGLNLGVQLHWMESLHGTRFKEATLLPWAQYWSWFLSGEAYSEVSSLGCHTDLWAPALGDFSPLARRRYWADRFAPTARAGDVIGTLRPELAARTGLAPDTRIHCGLHDSNAALVAARGFADLAGRDFMLLSTGTWFIGMRPLPEGAPLPALDEKRDCLLNVDVEGRMVSSARYMGGREVEILGGGIEGPGIDGLDEVLERDVMILPSFVPDCGPVPDGVGRWTNEPANETERRVAVALYAAMMTAVSLEMIGPADCVLVEGRFAKSELFTRALASALGGPEVLLCEDGLDASFGALRMIWPDLRVERPLRRAEPLPQTSDNDNEIDERNHGG